MQNLRKMAGMTILIGGCKKCQELLVFSLTMI